MTGALIRALGDPYSSSSSSFGKMESPFSQTMITGIFFFYAKVRGVFFCGRDELEEGERNFTWTQPAGARWRESFSLIPFFFLRESGGGRSLFIVSAKVVPKEKRSFGKCLRFQVATLEKKEKKEGKKTEFFFPPPGVIQERMTSIFTTHQVCPPIVNKTCGSYLEKKGDVNFIFPKPPFFYHHIWQRSVN